MKAERIYWQESISIYMDTVKTRMFSEGNLGVATMSVGKSVLGMSMVEEMATLSNLHIHAASFHPFIV